MMVKQGLIFAAALLFANQAVSAIQAPIALDLNTDSSQTEAGYTAISAQVGSSETVSGVTFTLFGYGNNADRDRNIPSALLTDFAFADGANGFIGLRIDGLPQGRYEIHSWHYDAANNPGWMQVEYSRQGEAPVVVADKHSILNDQPLSYFIESDGVSSYELRFSEDSVWNRARFNGITIDNAAPADQAVPVMAQYYVSPNGSDASAGTIDAPFKTIAHARDVVSSINADMTGDIYVYLRGGRYALDDTLLFDANDGATNGYRIHYEAYPSETPIISGGKQVTGWTQVPGESYYVADVPESAGFGDYFRQLYVNGVRAYRASSPWINGQSYYNDGATPQGADGVNFPASAVHLYENPTDLRLFHINAFKVDEWPVVAVKQNGGSIAIQAAQPHFQVRVNRGLISAGAKYMIVNAFEELDKPGEWYHNRVTDKVYYYPYYNEDMSVAEVYAPAVQADQIVRVEGAGLANLVRNITFKGITFEHSNWMFAKDYFIGGSQAEALHQGDMSLQSLNTYGFEVTGGIRLNHTDGIEFLDNVIRHMGNSGIHLYNDVGNTLIQGNVFHDLTASGVQVGRWLATYIDDDIPEEGIVFDNVIDNNIVEDVGRDYMQATGISLFPALRTTVTHNYINNTPYAGIHSRMQTNTADRSANIGQSYIAYNYVGQASWANLLYHVYDNASIYNYGPAKGTNIYRNYVADPDQGSRYSWNSGLYNDNDSYQIAYEQNVSLKMHTFATRTYTVRDSIIADTNYGLNLAEAYASIRNYIQLPGFEMTAWPQAAQDIANESGLEPAYAYLLDKLPTIKLPSYNYLNLTAIAEPTLVTGRPVSQSSSRNGGVAGRAVDGNTNGTWNAGSVTHTNNEANPWWQIDLESLYDVQTVTLYNRTDCCSSRLSNFYVFVSEADLTGRSYAEILADTTVARRHYPGAAPAELQLDDIGTGRYVRIQLAGTNVLSLAEVEIDGQLSIPEPQAPSITLNQPQASVGNAAGSIEAVASDADGTISSVAFYYNGSNLIKTLTSQPYVLNWSGVSDGTYTLTAKATDNDGLETISNAVEVVVNNSLNTAPTVILSPPQGSAGNVSGSIEATANDADGTITRVEFYYNGGNLLRTVTQAPYVVNWASVQDGTYELTAIAYDDAGAKTTSNTVTVVVDSSLE